MTTITHAVLGRGLAMLTANDIEAGDEGAAAPLEPIPVEPPLPMPKERMELGKSRRSQAPRSRTPCGSLLRTAPIRWNCWRSRTAHACKSLVPIRYGRMLASPFAFLRGSPIVMAHDLAATPVSGIRVQACGDAHLMNFGVYASPERNLLFDLNDFDETLPGPWEWDLKRLAASCVVAGRSHDIRERDCEDAARAAARSYRQRMATTVACVCSTSGILMSTRKPCSMWSAPVAQGVIARLEQGSS